MKEGWEYKKLGELGTFQRGGGFLKSDYVDNGFPCIHYGQIHTKFGVSVDRHLTSISKEKAQKSKIASKGDIIIAITSEDVEGSCKCTAWMGNYDVAIGAHTAIFKHNQNPLYISYVLRSKKFNEDKTKYAHGFKVVEIKPDDISKIAIPVAPISIQEHIVSELDLLSGVIEKQKAQLEELEKLAQSIFYGMFSKKEWDCKKIKDIAIVKIGPFGSALHQHDYISGGTPLVNPIHMKDGRIEADSNFTISDEKKKELSSYLLKIHDIVFGRRGDIGRCALVTQKENGFLCGTGSLFVRFTININPLYTLKILSSSSVKQYLLENARGATMLNLNSSVIEGISIPLPPLSLQQEFAAKVEAIEAMKAKVRLSLKEAETLFNSRMDYYFN